MNSINWWKVNTLVCTFLKLHMEQPFLNHQIGGRCWEVVVAEMLLLVIKIESKNSGHNSKVFVNFWHKPKKIASIWVRNQRIHASIVFFTMNFEIIFFKSNVHLKSSMST